MVISLSKPWLREIPSFEGTDVCQLAVRHNHFCQNVKDSFWQISPKGPNEDWKLQQTADDRWLLVIREQPQINFLPSEALAFLNRQRYKEC